MKTSWVLRPQPATSTESSVAESTRSGLELETLTLSRYNFVQQSENVNASTTRRAVRSHAMKAARRQQRQESAKTFRLKWPKEKSSAKKVLLILPDEQPFSFGLAQAEKKHGQEGSPDEGVISSTPSLERSKSTSSPGVSDQFPLGSWTIMNLPSNEADSLPSQEREASSQSTTADVDDQIPPTSTNVQTLLGAGRIKIFHKFPIRADRSMSQLIDHCTLPPYSVLLTSTRLQLCALAKMRRLRRCYHACNLLRHTVPQANSYRIVPYCHQSSGIDTCDGCLSVEKPGLPLLRGSIATYTQSYDESY